MTTRRPFTLVYRPALTNKERMRRAVAEALSQNASLLGGQFGKVLAAQTFLSDAADTSDSAARYNAVVNDLQRRPRVVRAGVWDLGAMIGFLADVLEQVNEAQSAITFFQVRAGVPFGLRRSPEGMRTWLRAQGVQLTSRNRSEIEANFLADDFFPQADRVRRELALDYIIGITPLMIAGSTPKAYWNYIGTSSGQTILVSAYDLPRFAAEAKRPIEACVGMLIAALLLDELNPRISHHAETRGCLFDRNDDRESIVESLRLLRIDDECRTLLRPNLRESSLAIADTLRRYERKGVSE